MATWVRPSEDTEETFGCISATAVQTITGCDAASISILDDAGHTSHGVTDELADLGDRIQYQEGEGPCLDALVKEHWIYTPDMTVADRWPMSSRRLAEELHVRSMFSCRLALRAAPTQTVAGINLYSRTLRAFSDEDQLLAILLSSLGAVVVDSSRQQAHLRAAIGSRQVIGEAVGILRAQTDATSEDAFAMLSKASQRMNVKVRDLAQRIADRPRPGSEPLEL